MYEEYAAGTEPDALHRRLYEGTVARFRDLAPMRDLVAYTRRFLEGTLATSAPMESHRGVDMPTLAGLYANAQREFARSPEAARLWRDLFEAVGLDPELTARDRLILRFQPPDPADGERPWARSTATVSFHRDTWGTNLYSQINWWAPVYPIDEFRTFAFFPELFDRPMANSSATFDISDVMRRNREAPETVKAGEMIPQPLEPIDWDSGLPVVIAPGEIIAFSAQHAHAAVRNRSALTRISLDTRTLRIPDHCAGRGARNVDGRARWMTPGMFRRLSDGIPLVEILNVDGIQPFEGAPQA